MKKLLEVPGRERRLFLEAVVLHMWIGLLLKVIPFRLFPRIFASRQFEAPTMEEAQTGHMVSGHLSEVIELTRSAIQRASVVSPWKNKCLVSSLAGRCMLRRRKIPSQLSLGVAKDADGKIIAHAWLMTGDVEIVPATGIFHELYHF